MHDVERVAWTSPQRELWQRIEAHAFERPDHALDFTKRLARDRSWPLDFARGAVREYRRFCFLAMAFDTPSTPSEEVDEVWHQHLTYSRDYWDVWCGHALQGRLHHDPTAGGPAEQARYRAQYAETLARYEAHFGPPDPAYWPGTRQRFRGSPRYRMVDADRVLVLPRPRLGWLTRAGAILGPTCLGLLPQPADALPLNPLDWPGSPFLLLYAWLAFTALGIALLVRDHLRRSGPAGGVESLDVVDLAYLAGGYERASDTVIIGLVEAGAATHASGSAFITIDDRSVVLPARLEPFRGTAAGNLRRSALLRALRPKLEFIRERLVRASLAPSDETLQQMTLATLALVGPVLAFGLAKVIIGSARDKPIGFLFALMVVTLVLCIAILQHRPTCTSAGEAALARYRQQHGRAARAPREGQDELLFAFALGGIAVLAGTPHEAYGRATKSSGDGGSSGCGSGDGGGGGGCGGCGGGD